MIIKAFEKLPQHLKVASISWLSRAVYVLASLYGIKLVTSLLNETQFAIYAILSNIISWLLLVDLGMGFSIQNFVSELKVKKRNYGIYILVGISISYIVGIIIALILTYFSKDLSALLFNKFYLKGSTSAKNISDIFYYSAIWGLVTGVGMISHKILYAMQKGYWPNLLGAISALITLCFLIIFKGLLYKNLYWVLFIYFGPNILISIIPSLYYFILTFFQCYKTLTIKYITLISKRIFSRGLSFFIFTLTAGMVLQIDYLVMSQTVSADQIGLYNIVFKIYNSFFLVYTTLLLALWPSFAEWYVERKFEEIYAHCRKYILLGVLFILFVSLVFAINTNMILNIVSTIKFSLPLLTLILFAIYFSLRVWTDTYALVLQSSSKVKALWFFTPLQAVVSLILQIFLSKKFGINGILAALILSFLLTVAWGLPYQVSAILRYKK